MFFNCLKAEIQKSKRTYYVWLTIISSILVPFIMFLVYTFKSSLFIPKQDVNPWYQLFETCYSITGSLLFPFFIIILISLITQIEHKNKMWQKIFVLPVRKEIYFLSKYVFVLLIIFISLLLFDFGIILSGFLSGLIKPQLNFLQFKPDILLLTEYSLLLFINVLAVISIQFSLSLFSKNFIIPSSVGLFLSITGLILAEGWKYSIYFPYSFGHIYLKEIKEISVIEHIGVFSISEIVSIIMFSLISIITLYLYTNKSIK